MNRSSVTTDVQSPDELEAMAHEKIAEGNALLAKAKRLRIAGTSSVPRWLDDKACRERYGCSIAVFTAAAKRGEIEIGRVGRSPRVREDVADRWVAERARKAPPPADAAPADVYSLAVARMRGADR